MVGCDFRRPYSDSDDDVLHAEGHDGEVRNEWSVDSWTAGDSCAEGCAQLDDFNHERWDPPPLQSIWYIIYNRVCISSVERP